jgi:predicted AAA+ superfamily ATPase
MVERWLGDRLEDHLSTFRVVVLGGARQAGKTTLVQSRARMRSWQSVTLDDPATLAAARTDPVGFVDALQRPAVIDEVQRAGPELLLTVKQIVDADRTRGQFLLTGSSQQLARDEISETLAGRAGRLTLWTLSQGELRRQRETFVDDLLAAGSTWEPPSPEHVARDEVLEAICTGGYPEVCTEAFTPRQRADWFASYLHDVISREAIEPQRLIRSESDLRQVLALAAARTAQPVVARTIASETGLDARTVRSHVDLLEALHLLTRIPAWSTNAVARATRSAKVVVTDAGLAAHLLGVGRADLARPDPDRSIGQLVETFVIGEIARQASWSERQVDLTHLRDRNGLEVDLIVRDRGRDLVHPVEVKATSTPRPADARHLVTLRDRLGKQFGIGVVLHLGTQRLRLSDRIWAVPVAALWS